MASGFELEGKLEVIGEIQEFSSGFTKREFVVETMDGQYPQMVKFECVKDRTSLTEAFQKGDTVNVHFNIRGNEYKGKYYVNLVAWKLEGGSGGGAPDYAKADMASYGDEDGPPKSRVSEPPA
ncbi:MAG: DUF3127 domain-containing protein, partial [Verrucomicrobiota bacterium]